MSCRSRTIVGGFQVGQQPLTALERTNIGAGSGLSAAAQLVIRILELLDGTLLPNS